MPIAFDATDLKLLALLQADALMSADELAAQVALSPSAIARRVRRLRAEKIIAADVAVVADAVGPFLSGLVHIQLARHDRAAVDAFRARLIASPRVQMVMEVSGAFDIALLVTTTDMDAFNVFVDGMLGNDPAVQRYETSFVKRRHKLTPALPLGDVAPR